MRAYVALFTVRVRMLLQYRLAAIAGLVTQVFWGVVRMMIFEGFYAASVTPPPITLEQALTYIWLGQGFFRMIPWAADKETAQNVRDGTVAYDLVRPTDLYWTWYSRALAILSAPTIMRAVPLLTIAFWLFGLRGPASLTHFAAFVPSIIFGLFISAAIVTMISISLFWTISGEGIYRLLPAAVWMLSGIVIPIPFYPDSLRLLLEVLPTSCIVDTPFRIYTGQYAPEQFLSRLLLQAFWTVVLILIGRTILSRGTRRLVIQGG